MNPNSYPNPNRQLRNKWVYRLKEEDGSKKIFKDKLVVKGFAQKKGIDFDEICSPIVQMTSILTISCTVATKDLNLEKHDVKATFLYGDLDEEIYMTQPQGFTVKAGPNMDQIKGLK